MPAHVDERPEHIVPVADEDDGDMAGPRRDERARLDQVAGVPGVLPRVSKDPLLLEPGQREHMIALTGRRTVPQIFIGDTHVGGCDDLMALDQRGALAPLLAR